MPMSVSSSLRRALVLAVAACVLAACGHSSGAKSVSGMDMKGMDGANGMNMNMGGSGDDMPGMAEPSGPKIVAAAASDNGLHGAVGGYSYVADASTVAAGSAVPFTFHINGPSGKAVTRFQPYEGQLLVFYVVRTDLGDFRQLTASMRADGTWTVPLPALPAGSYRTYITFAAPDSSAGTPLSYSLSQPLTVPGSAAGVTLPAASDTATADGYALRLTGSPHQGGETGLGVAVTKDGKPVQQFDRLLDGYAHLTAFHSGDAAFARALSTGRSAGGASGAGALTAQILFPEPGAWRLFVQFQTSGVVHTAAFTVEVP
ncbi:conserved hypothetical protein [Catenulispora acidiphila DSM 44928]|uniref:Secreted protein n=2 Tax=Catenulispora TaxID=414878 RepID=C7QJR3_CATAD|nr:conserved hypothetical protein [Catenulispora acidiphila DSM 44928]